MTLPLPTAPEPEYDEAWVVTSAQAFHREIGRKLDALKRGEPVDLQSLQGQCAALESTVWCIEQDRRQPVPALRVVR